MNDTTNGYYACVALGFAKTIDTDLIAFVRNVIALMTNNTQYPTPMPTLAVLTTSVNAFETAVHDALDGGKIAIATRNAARVELLALMRQLAAYVQASRNAEARRSISGVPFCRGAETPTPLKVRGGGIWGFRRERTGVHDAGLCFSARLSRFWFHWSAWPHCRRAAAGTPGLMPRWR